MLTICIGDYAYINQPLSINAQKYEVRKESTNIPQRAAPLMVTDGLYTTYYDKNR